MGKHLRRKHSGIPFENHHPGCMWGILHILDYHHWRHVKKMLPYKRRGGGKRAGVQNQGDDLSFPTGELQEIDAEMDNSVIEEKMTVSSPSSRGSVKARIKARFAVERSRRRGKHERSSTSPAELQMAQTDSIHHLEPLEQDSLAEINLNVDSPRYARPNYENSSASCTLDSPLASSASGEPINSKEKCEACGNTLLVNYLGHDHVNYVHGKKLAQNHTLLEEKLDSAKQIWLEQKLKYAKEQTRDAPLYHSKEFLDALDIVNLDRELFITVLQDQGSPLSDHFQGRQAFSQKIGLAKSGSFPVAGSSGKRVPGPGELEQKLKEIRTCAKERELQVFCQAQMLGGFRSAEDISEQEMPCIVAMNMVDGNSNADQARPETSDNASPSSPILKNRNENQLAIKRFKYLKQRIKHAINERKKERHRITMDAILHRIPYGRNKDVKKEITDQWKELAMDIDGKDSPASSYDSDHSGPVLSKRRLRRIRRTSSLTDSLHRYCQLYESTFNTEAKYNIPQRLKLRTEEVSSPDGIHRESLGRIFSLPDLKSYNYLQSEDSPDNSFGYQKMLDSHSGLESKIQLDTLVESGREENLVEESEMNPDFADQTGSSSFAFSKVNTDVSSVINDLGNLTPSNKASCHEWEIGSTSELVTKLPEPSTISVLDSIYHEDMTAKFPIPEDSQLKPRRLFLDGPDSFTKQKDDGMDSPAVAESKIDLEKAVVPSKHLDSDSLHFQVDTKDNVEFNYVRDVLEHSGFMKSELQGTWHATDQPVDPSVYEEVEGGLPLGHECSEDEEGGYSNHLLLFDLINEVLMGLYDSSFSYCPIPFSSLTHVRPMPVGYHVLEEVWANISWHLSSRPEFDQSVDYLVCRDLSKGNGWMNLQFDTECVGLELEDLIFEDLLEEVICI